MVNKLFPEHSSPQNTPFKQDSKPKPVDTATATVSQSLFESIKQNVSNKVTQYKHKAIAKAANFLCDQYAGDKQFLVQLTGSDVCDEINKFVPQLPEVIQKLFSGTISQFASSQKMSTEKVTETLMLHIVANLAAAIYPNEAQAFHTKKTLQKTVSLNQLTQEVTTHLMLLIAKEVDTIDQEIHSKEDITIDRFEPFAKKLMTLIIPPEKTGILAWGEQQLGNYLLKDLSNVLMQIYRPFGVWFVDGGNLTFNTQSSSDMLPILEPFIAYTTGCMADYHLQQDEEILQDLTGENDIQKNC